MHVPMQSIRLEMNTRHDEKLTIAERDRLNQQREGELEKYRKYAIE